MGEQAAQGRVWAGLREREGELGGSRAGPAWEKVKRWVGLSAGERIARGR